MQTGTIVRINPRNGMFIVQFDDGNHAVYELLDSIALEVGDQVRAAHNELASQQLTHLGHAEAFEAYGQSGDCSRHGLNPRLKD